MITFTGFKKKKKNNKERSRKKKMILITLAVLSVMVALMFLFNALLIGTNTTAQFAGITKLNPSTDKNVKSKTDDEIAYDTDVYSYELSDDEKQQLLDKGYTEEQIENGNVDDFIKELYGIEAYVQNLYMVRYTSPYENAKEPSESQRDQLYNTMLNSFINQDYSNVVYQFQQALKKYNFTNYLDESITSLYHDAAARIDQGLLNGTKEEGDDLDELLKESLQDAYSVEGLLYDTFTYSISVMGSTIADNSSCTPLGNLSEIVSYTTYDPQTDDFDHKDDMNPLANIVYAYEVVDTNGNKATVYIESIKLAKNVIGVYYENSDSCVLKSSLSN